MNRVKGVLGLARRAGALAVGTVGVVDAIRSGKAKLVLIADGVSENTRKRLTDKASFRSVPTEFLPFGAEELGHCVGKGDSSSAAILQENFVISYRKARSDPESEK